MKSRCINRELTMEIIVGAFMASVLIVLAVFTIVVSGGRLLNQESYFWELRFDNVAGLSRHDNVVVRGMPVGQVESLGLAADGVHVRVRLSEKLALREGYRARVIATSVLGGNHLAIYEGPDDGASVPVNTVLNGDTPADLMGDVSELIRGVRQSLLDDGVLANLKDTSDGLRRIVERLESGEGTLGSLLSADNTLYEDLKGTVGSLRAIATRLESGEGALGKLLSTDTALYDDLSATMANVKSVSARLERGEGTLGRLLASDDPVYEDLAAVMANLHSMTDRIQKGQGTIGKLLSAEDSLYDDLAATASSARSVMERIERGEGLIGKLMSDDEELYGEVQALVEDARQTLDDMRETSPIVTFTSIFFGVF